MSHSLEQYARHLDGRHDLSWPSLDGVHGTKSKPHLKNLPGIRAVTWNVYGTLLSIAGGELYLEHPQSFIMELALGKTVQEFKMWGAMSRKAIDPAKQMREMLKTAMLEVSLVVDRTEKNPEIPVEKAWEKIIRNLMQNDYSYNAGFYGSLSEFAAKVAYFFHRSLQATECDEGVAETLRWLKEHHYWQGIIADGQCFTPVQLQRGLEAQDPHFVLDYVIPSSNRAWSFEVRSKKPSERLFRDMVHRLERHGISPEETLHVSNDLPNDLVPAQRLGFKTCLFAGDSSSLKAAPELVQDKKTRPMVLITDFRQIMTMLSRQAA